GPFVAWDELNGTQWDVVVYDMAEETTTRIGTSTTDEFAPVLRGSRLAYIGTSTGALLVHVSTYDEAAGTWGAPIVQSGPGGGAGHQAVVMDFVGLAWADGRAVSGTPTATSDWDFYGAPFVAGAGLTAFPGENAIDTRIGAQIVRDMDSQIIVFDDHDGTSWDIGLTSLGGTPGFA